MLAELLVIKGSGLNARAFGEPAVQGPSNCQSECRMDSSSLLTSLESVVLELCRSVVGSIACQLRRRRVAGVIVWFR